MAKRIEVRHPHLEHGADPPEPAKKCVINSHVPSVEPEEKDWHTDLLKRELDEMRLIRSGADIALIVVERLPSGDLIYCTDVF